MELEMRPVRREDKEILRNLMEKYDYEFSQYDGRDVNALGLFGYDYLDCYWTDKNRFAYFIMAGGHLAGFAMVNDYMEADKAGQWNMAEFFVLYKYRRAGVGRYAARWLFDKYKGRWELMRHPKNLPSVAFWDKVISEYTGGQYTLLSPSALTYPDGIPGDVFLFTT